MKFYQEHKGFLIKIWRLIRPEFYNRLTWLIVISGIGLIGTSIFEAIIEAFFLKEFDILLPNQYEPWFGLILIIIALVYNTIIKFRQQNKNQVLEPLIELAFTSESIKTKEIPTILRDLKNEFSDLNDPQLKLLVLEVKSNFKALGAILEPEKMINLSDDFKNEFISTSRDKEKLIFKRNQIIEFLTDKNNIYESFYS
ncbi:hypothetical protein [Aquimarina litoralis]|uniref:hypothetical protein n=1 Tax=Aquimarina litoralis TaxID=584605 RepID=UPI001C570C02|nr:hypothetical protein [Aquimarina litoralis]MBW1297825.1 hypothetical protein [Aquimarina litoralis]